MGDFNSITTPNEHKGGHFHYYASKPCLFSDFIAKNALMDLDFVGHWFSWCNGQYGQARRWACLDHCSINAQWSSMFNSYKLTHLPKISSNHSPLLLNVVDNTVFRHKIFCFEIFWFENMDCLMAVLNALIFNAHSSPMHNFAHMLTRIRKALLHVKNFGLGALDSVIRDTEVQLQSKVDDMLNPLSDSNYVRYRALQNKYNAYLRQNSIRWAQKARLMWTQDGDRNSSFFHSYARICNHNNRISYIFNEEGQYLVEHDHLEDGFINFYSNLWIEMFPTLSTISCRPYLMIYIPLVHLIVNP